MIINKNFIKLGVINMAFFFPKTPINSKDTISGVIANIIHLVFDEDTTISHQERIKMKRNLRDNAKIEGMYDIYLKIISGQLYVNSYEGNLIKKSVNLSYGSGILGLSRAAKEELLTDIYNQYSRRVY